MKIEKGIISVFKPKGISSFGIIRKLRQITGIRKIGHAGTLDPLAKGVLVVGIGKQACQKLNKVVVKEKEYLAKIRLGASSPTNDSEGEIIIKKINKEPSFKKIEKTLLSFKGKKRQKPPIFSAVKVNGQPAYKLARRGQRIALKSRLVELKEVEIVDYSWPYLKLKIITGPGFYVRSLARDLGKKLKTTAYLAELERTRVGKFKKENSIKL